MAVLRLRPRQLPSFLVTLRVTAADGDPSSALHAADPSASVSVPSTPVAALLSPPSPAGSRLSEVHASPATGNASGQPTLCVASSSNVR